MLIDAIVRTSAFGWVRGADVTIALANESNEFIYGTLRRLDREARSVVL